ncbi:MAG: hypothetical protein GX992_03415, partial [Clostridium sp.]|nr:hypothetical protein [Clostridium sp.]
MENILRNAFYEETDEVFQEIEDCLLEIDSQGSTKTRIDNLFRYVHTLKGSSATMGIEDMAKLTHHLEDVMGKARDGDFELTKEMVSWIFSCLDELRIKVDKHKKDETYEIDVEKFIYSPKLSFTDAKNNGDINKTPNTPSGQQDTGGIKLLNLEERIYKIKIGLRPDSELVGARLYVVLDRLKKEGRIHSTSWEGIEPEEVEGQKFEIVFVSQLMRKEIEELILEVSNIEKIDIAEIDKPNKEENRGHGEEGIQSVIRVSIDKLDKLLRIVEELSVDKERLKQVMGAVEQKYGKDGDVKNLVKLVKQIDFIGNEMQETVMSTRMYTLDSVFRRFPRMVRDLSIKQGKEIELELEGESTELDRSIIEKIVDPLTHIVRNSIDHGIEKPDEREQCGKNRRGIIKLSAGQEDGHIYISAKDDGRGIEIEKLKQNA